MIRANRFARIAFRIAHATKKGIFGLWKWNFKGFPDFGLCKERAELQWLQSSREHVPFCPVGTGKGTGKLMRTRLSKLPFSKLHFTFSPM